jgi:antimicrobial peptide system SdpA family protein
MKQINVLLLTFIAVILFWGFIAFNSAVSALPYNPFTGSKMRAIRYSVILPQGWAFFTRSPREEQYYAYQMEGGHLKPMIYPNSSYQNAFGFSRGVRVRGVELGGLIEQLKNREWQKCPDGVLSECISMTDSLPAMKAFNSAHYPSYCGEIWLERKPLVPWAWSRVEKPVNMPSEFIKINVSCNR